MTRRCFRDPIAEIFDSARYLDAAVSAHQNGHVQVASELFRLADDKKVWDWTESIWGKNSTYVIVNRQPQIHSLASEKAQKPDLAMKRTCMSEMATIANSVVFQ